MSPMITAHAIRRFAERILGFSGLPDDDREAVWVIGNIYGLDPSIIEGWLEALVGPAVAVKARGITLGGVFFKLDGRKLVTVVLGPSVNRIDRRSRKPKRPPRHLIDEDDDFP